VTQVVFHPKARRELLEAAARYDAEKPGLGLDFLDTVERATRLIIQHPEASPVVLANVRRRLVARFPYAIVYSSSPGRIIVSAIAHHSRRPFYWRRRI
jgi:plasmid stabilization system protein ParE